MIEHSGEDIDDDFILRFNALSKEMKNRTEKKVQEFTEEQKELSKDIEIKK